jgi:two-component system OmpR family sensor kinase
VSLRTRLLAGMVALVGLALLAGAIVTYAEQRSFLYQRADQQLRSALAPVSFALSRRYGVGAAALPALAHARRPRPRPRLRSPAVLRHRARRALAFLPPGSFGELVGDNGRVIGQAILFRYGAQRPPALPRRLARERSSLSAPRMFTFTADGSAYRAVAITVPDGAEVVAVSLRDVQATLGRLVLVEALVGAGVLAMLIVVGGLVIQLGLRPLRRIERTACEIAHGDLSRRIEPADLRTEVGRLAASLNDMLAQIERAFADRRASEERLRQFVADASHELRTPLAAIRGYAELHRLGALRDTRQLARALGHIEAEARRMSTLVEDLLTLARLDELPMRQAGEVDLGALAQQALKAVRPAAPDRSIGLEVCGPGELVVCGDAGRLRQMLENLLRNAIIHTPAGTPVQVTVCRRGARVITEVRDHGPGLPAVAPGRIFERFWRSERGRRRGPGGAGLGLAIVKAVVDAHGGQIQAENAPGGGASFRVTLPASAGRCAEPASGVAPASDAAPASGVAAASGAESTSGLEPARGPGGALSQASANS